MTTAILQINLNYAGSETDLREAFAHAAEAIAAFPGLAWKIWIINSERQEAGGLYCFESAQALQTYLDSPIIAALKSIPGVTQVQAKPFAPIESFTAITRGPLPLPTP